jgi:hypothetical protein
MAAKPTLRELAETRAETINNFAGEVARLRSSNAELLQALCSIRETLDMLGPGNSKAQLLGQVVYARSVSKAAIHKAGG